MWLVHGPDGISTTGKKGQPITILCSIVVRYQRPTKTLLWPPCYLICECLFMCIGCLWECEDVIYMLEYTRAASNVEAVCVNM